MCECICSKYVQGVVESAGNLHILYSMYALKEMLEQKLNSD